MVLTDKTILITGGTGSLGKTLVRRLLTNEIGRRGLYERRGEPLLPIVDAARHLALHVFHELVHFALHLLDLAAHIQNDFDAGEIDAEISGK